MEAPDLSASQTCNRLVTLGGANSSEKELKLIEYAVVESRPAYIS
jgi:hypothetical protein